MIGSAIVIAGGLIAGALILKDTGEDQGAAASATCQAWTETSVTLRSIPALPAGWTWATPNIDTYIKIQNAPVGDALDRFEAKIGSEPADVAQAAHDYVAARRRQMQLLADHAYTAGDGTAVDAALAHLDQICGIKR